MRRSLVLRSWLLSVLALALGCGGSGGSGGSGGAGAMGSGGAGTGTGASAGHGSGAGAGTGTGTGGSGPGIAAQYPGDVGIGQDPAVVWAENFEEGSVAAVTARYDDFKNPGGMQLVADVAPNSGGSASARWTAGGANSATDLYKQLPNHDELWWRWYVKYDAGVNWHHSGTWVGGYNPPIPYPNPQAGLKPNGDDRFAVSIEPIWNVGAANPRLDFYDYWMTMHSWMAQPMGNTAYYGNAMVHQNAFTVDEGQWMCLEVHVRLNTDPASAAGGLLEVWKNDALVQHFDESGALGYWIRDKFCPEGADGSECTDYPPAPGTPMIPLDLQWRSTTALQLNYFWPQNYVTDPAEGALQFDDMVVATARIGCIVP
jgi:hypothetical protein